MIKETQKELRYTIKAFDIELDINGKNIVIDLTVDNNTRFGLDTNYKITKGNSELSDTEKDELDDYIITNY